MSTHQKGITLLTCPPFPPCCSYRSQLLKFGRGNKTIVGMVSSEKESFDFRQPVPVEGPVEGWMTGVEAEMRRTLHAATKEGVFRYAKAPRCA
jgi:hypothetical protein